MPLEDYIDKNNQNLKVIKSVNEIPKDQDFVLMVAANWCPHCKNQITNTMNKDCKNLKSKCLLIDGDSPDGRNLTKQIGLQVQAYPTTAMCKHDPNGKNTTCSVEIGSMPSNDFQQKLKQNKIN